MSARKDAWVDDGRTIAPMDLPGMPRARRNLFSPVKRQPLPATPPAEPLTKRQMRQYMLASIGTGLLVALAFIAAGALFILFAQHVWLR